VEIFLGIGSNLGDRLQNLNECMNEFSIIQKSSIYETEPVGFLEQPWFLNAVVQIDSTLTPRELLKQCQSIETRLERKREIPKGPRSIDIDILFFGDQIIQESDLMIPHPEIANRRFVLIPMNQIAPHFLHPVLKKSISELLQVCSDTSMIMRFPSTF
jgi:2-amino-4-hydroxy-6-hydroxymethyldihydropteridine diphosphokinase